MIVFTRNYLEHLFHVVLAYPSFPAFSCSPKPLFIPALRRLINSKTHAPSTDRSIIANKAMGLEQCAWEAPACVTGRANRSGTVPLPRRPGWLHMGATCPSRPLHGTGPTSRPLYPFFCLYHFICISDWLLGRELLFV
jgi:hypothetical protein